MEDPKVLKLFHFARFDLAALKKYVGAATAPVYCTRTASKLVRTFTDRHGLKDLCRELIGVEISKQRSEEHTSELQSLMRISYAVFCLKKKTNSKYINTSHITNMT